jgi:hypothetical protein
MKGRGGAFVSFWLLLLGAASCCGFALLRGVGSRRSSSVRSVRLASLRLALQVPSEGGGEEDEAPPAGQSTASSGSTFDVNDPRWQSARVGLQNALNDLPQPLIRDSLPPERSWEEDQELLGDKALARELSKETNRNDKIGKEARTKMVQAMFDEGEQTMRKMGERLKADMDAAVPRMKLEADERTAAAQVELGMRIDRVIANFTRFADDNELDLGAGRAPLPGSRGGSQSSTLPNSLRDVPPEMERIVLVGSEGELGDALQKRLEGRAVFGLTMEDVRIQLSKAVNKQALGTATLLILAPDSRKEGGGGGGGGGAWAFLGKGGGGTPSLREASVQSLLSLCGPSLRHVVCLSAIGCNRVGEMPFSLANIGGALDEKRAMEQAIVRSSLKQGFDYTFVRVGKLQGQGPAGVAMEYGDALQGDTPRSLAEEAIMQSLHQLGARNSSFSIVGGAVGSSAPDQATWDDQFLRLVGPELLRVPLDNVVTEGPLGAFILLRDWAERWKRPKSGLTTPVKISIPDDHTIYIEFDPPRDTYISAQEEKEAERRREAGEPSTGAGFRRSSDKRQGGVRFVIEENVAQPRIRVIRGERGPGVALKEMSEATILRQFKNDIMARSDNS